MSKYHNCECCGYSTDGLTSMVTHLKSSKHIHKHMKWIENITADDVYRNYRDTLGWLSGGNSKCHYVCKTCNIGATNREIHEKTQTHQIALSIPSIVERGEVFRERMFGLSYYYISKIRKGDEAVEAYKAMTQFHNDLFLEVAKQTQKPTRVKREKKSQL